MKSSRIFRFLSALVLPATIGLIVGTAGPVSASTLSCDANTQSVGHPGNKVITYTFTSAADALCVDSKNDSNTFNSGYEIFGDTGWLLADKSGGPEGDGKVSFTTLSTSDGTWALSSDAFTNASKIIVTLKQANSFAAFLIKNGVTNGTWSTLKDGDPTGLSHGSIYYLPGTSTVVPLPASALLLLSAVGGLGLFGWRRRTAA